jgi:mono/diheme cytochrome c family protein
MVGRAKAFVAAAALAVLFAAGIYLGLRPAVQPVPPTVAVAAAAPLPVLRLADEVPGYVGDPDQRSLSIYEFKKAAESGPERGREIFYYKCWFCHNAFADGAPKLKGVYDRKQLLSGRPTTDDGIKDEIRNGGAGMAAYRYTLSDADLNDLVAYIREDCCWNSNRTPANPRYRYAEDKE